MLIKQGKRPYTQGVGNQELIGTIGYTHPVELDRTLKKRVLITGAHSYIGESFEKYAKRNYTGNFQIDTLDMLEDSWRQYDFSKYDVVYHVAGIAHADVGNVSEETKEKYYKVNTDLAIEVCQRAKEAGVRSLIFMSSMIIYGESAPYGRKKIITKNTIPVPANFYGDSKLQADVGVRQFADEQFQVLVLRPPMIYGKGSKGNYPLLAKMARILPVFPDINNQRSMLHIDNLCEFLCQIMLVKSANRENSMVLFPQNPQWVRTSEMVSEIGKIVGKPVHLLKGLNPLVCMGSKVPGKIGELVNKAFGNYCYAHEISIYEGIDYQKISLKESIKRTEGNVKSCKAFSHKKGHTLASKKTHILVVSQYFYPETFRINDMCQEWVRRGYKVTVVTGIPNYPMGNIYDGYGYTKKRHEKWNGIEIIRIPLIPRGNSAIGMIANYLSFMLSGILAGELMNIKADYVFSFEVSPMTQVLTGISFAKKLGVPHYLYIQDLWPENVITVTGISNPAVIRPIDKMVDYIYKNTDEIFTTSPSFVEAICNRKVKVDRSKVHYWPQYAEEFYHPMEKTTVAEIPDDNSFKVIFTGNIGTAQGLDILPKTAELLKNENVKFVMVGDGRSLEAFNNEVKVRGVENKFVMVPRQPAERIPELLAVCDVAFLSFKDDPLWRKTIPAKLQSYMACGKPILAAAQGEIARIINEAKCGICSSIGDAKGLSEAIIMMKSSDLIKMGINSRKYFDKNFDKKFLMDKMDRFYEK